MKKRLRMDRAIGAIVLAIAAGAALMVWAALSLSDPEPQAAPHRHVVFGIPYWIDDAAPSLGLIAAAIVVAFVLASAVAIVERTVANRYRRSGDVSIPLAPKLVMAETYGVFNGPVTITVLIPAHNEADRIQATLASLWAQHEPPERVIVVADNCTDDTAELARSSGAEVFATVDNVHKEAGGLNQALAMLLPGQGENDAVMIMDADTVLDQGYFAAARAKLTDDRALMAVGGLFYGEPWRTSAPTASLLRPSGTGPSNWVSATECWRCSATSCS